ncbi:MAG: DNA mismatch repair endonuclease MutL [Thermoplasmata archaeon]
MGGRIKVLDDLTVDKIAAGEVVERPASVLKELVENALDAGASSVSMSVEDGGRKLVSVRDDGCGMSRDDAQAAFRRHATSKISTIEDLQRLISYGFRGEALSSIASVSKVTLRTREHGSTEGTEVVIQSGSILTVSATGCSHGTEVCVEDLFYNVPARRKSLRSERVELAHCKEVAVNYMLCRPGVSFSFRADGRTELVHVPAEDIRGSLSAAFGPKVAENILFGTADRDGIRVEAYMGRLEHTRSSPSDIKLFVNDRPVRSPRLVSAAVEAYGSKLMKDRYPVGAVRIFVDSSRIDVNVHPAKREVRFEDEAAVLEVLRRSIENSLAGPDLSFQFGLTRFSESFETAATIPSQETGDAVQTVLGTMEKDVSEEGRPTVVPLAQIMNTYILAESRGNLLLLDQHAASERIVYESILRSLNTGKEISQELLTPLVIRLSASEERVLEENRETLRNAGFTVERFGRDSHALRSIPTVLGVAQGESALRNILGDLAHMSAQKRPGLDVIWRVACHTAIRAGDPLSGGQMRQLVSELMRTESPYTCEHGRPTMIVLSPADLEKLFKRRV